MRVTLRPTIAEDIQFVTDKPLPARIQGITAELDGRVLGIGGFSFREGGSIVAFVAMTDEAREYPVAIHRAGLAAMALARREGYPRIVAEAESDNPAAERWLVRLGFRRTVLMGREAFIWERAGQNCHLKPAAPGPSNCSSSLSEGTVSSQPRSSMVA
jgi:hypothetical protein